MPFNTCSCAGDRIVGHNAIRNAANAYCEEAVEAGLRPEQEKANLLPEPPEEYGLPRVASLRHPADIWNPRNASGKGEAFDFAASSLSSSTHVPTHLA